MTKIVQLENERQEVREPRFKLIPFDSVIVGSTRVYLIKGIIPRTGLTVIWGPPKCGKSFFTFDMVMHIALDWAYRGRRVQQGPVVYLALEGGEGFKARIEAFRQRHTIERAGPVPFFLVAVTINLVKDHLDLIGAIRAQNTEEANPAVVVIDTLNRSLAGSESDDKDMAAYVQAADTIRAAFGCAVVIVHHCGVDGSRPRGHTSLTGAVDAQLAVKRDASDNIVVTVEYMKDGLEGDQLLSRLNIVEVGTDCDGDAITSCVIEPVDGPATREETSKSSTLTKGAKIALRALTEAIVECGEAPPASNHIPEGVRCVTKEQWRHYAYRRGISSSEEARAKQKAFKDSTERLIADLRVGVWDDMVWVVAA